MAGFDHIKNWVFDLDNTLYPPKYKLFDQIDVNMTGYIKKYLGLGQDEAYAKQKYLYQTYGTTLNGLMAEHNIDPDEFLGHVHQIDTSDIPPNAELRNQLFRITEERENNRRIVYTNGTRKHAINVMDALEITDMFDIIIGIRQTDFVPKPKAEAFDKFFKMVDINPKTSVMFEDLPVNLKVPKQRGMTTVLVQPAEVQHPDSKWAFDGNDEHIEYKTKDLEGFLEEVI
ncbi:MAG: pyrimidine 5'-nucleotidase [Rhizobiales bacterium]|nr:pyrimidine 5'-nucleotidase [Hyphomicrobiales bacterium]NRB14284.1 pyrimidine 5'-nucleotidase [Hyphomicrobiales bacterium]